MRFLHYPSNREADKKAGARVRTVTVRKGWEDAFKDEAKSGDLSMPVMRFPLGGGKGIIRADQARLTPPLSGCIMKGGFLE